jgi:hypothetical protein
MERRIVAVLLAVTMVLGASVVAAPAAELKPIHAQTTKEAVITLMSESGQWKPGKNSFVLEFRSAKDKTPIDPGKVTLSTSMNMPGMAPMLAGATLSPDKAPGRYLGTISFPDSGARQVTVTWDGPAGKGSARFTVPVR